MIPGRFTRSDRGLGLAKHVLRRALWLLVAADAGERDPPQPLGLPVSGLARERHGLLDRCPGTRQLPALLECPAEANEQQRARGPVGDQVGRAVPEVDLGEDVPPVARSASGGCQPFRGACAQSGIGRAELHPVAIRLLQVVPDDLVELEELDPVLLEPRRVSLMEVRTSRFGERLVRSVAEEEVAEAEAVVAGDERLVRSNDLLADECGQARSDLGVVGCDRLDGAAVEDLALDCAPLEHAALGRLELVEACSEEGTERRRDGHRAVRLGGDGEHLADEERVAACGACDPLAQLTRDPLRNQIVDRLVGHRFEPQHHGPGGAALTELGTRHAEH